MKHKKEHHKKEGAGHAKMGRVEPMAIKKGEMHGKKMMHAHKKGK